MNLNETQVRIYNLALIKLGITEVLTAPTDDVKTADVLNAVWEQVLNTVLELGEWRSARKRVTLERDKDTVEGATQADPVVITATAHTFLNDDLVKFEEVGGMTELNGNTYMVKNKAADTFELWDENGTVKLDGSAFGAWTSGGTIYRVPNWDYAYMFKLPDDCIKVLEVELNVAKGGWREEYNYLISNHEDDELSILYLHYLTGPTYFSPLLAETVAARLAAVAGPALKADPQKIATANQDFAALLSQARGHDARYRDAADRPSARAIDVD